MGIVFKTLGLMVRTLYITGYNYWMAESGAYTRAGVDKVAVWCKENLPNVVYTLDWRGWIEDQDWWIVCYIERECDVTLFQMVWG